MNDSFGQLQCQLADRWRTLHQDAPGAHDVVVLPSLSLEGASDSSIVGLHHYEERMLFSLNLLRYPRVRVIYLTSTPIDTAIIDYFLSLIGGIPAAHMRRRLHLLSTYDASARPLTEKILQRPRLISRIKHLLRTDVAHLTCFSVSKAEQELAIQLGIPLYGVHPDLLWLGTKSGSRAIFREAGVAMPAGEENLRDEADIVDAVAKLYRENPSLNRVVVKQNTGFSGQGNAVIDLSPLRQQNPDESNLPRAIASALPRMRFADTSLNWDTFRARFEREQGIVEAFLEADELRAPSAQLRITPLGQVEAVSTHDQLVEGPDGQVYAGCRFPADDVYRAELMQNAQAVGDALLAHGALGRFAVDFMALRDKGGDWKLRAIEINLRLGGTTHPMMLLRMMTQGDYDLSTGQYLTHRGEPQYYTATDSLKDERFVGLLPEDLLDVAAIEKLHYQNWTESGTLFHFMGALSQFGKLGITSIGKSREEAQRWFDRTQQILCEKA